MSENFGSSNYCPCGIRVRFTTFNTKWNACYVVSYENFGTALTWFDDFVENKEKQYCENPVDLYQQEHKEGMQRLFAHWEEQASVPKADLLAAKLGESETKVLHICLTPRSEKIAVGLENKFKLLGVRVY